MNMVSNDIDSKRADLFGHKLLSNAKYHFRKSPSRPAIEPGRLRDYQEFVYAVAVTAD